MIGQIILWSFAIYGGLVLISTLIDISKSGKRKNSPIKERASIKFVCPSCERLILPKTLEGKTVLELLNGERNDLIHMQCDCGFVTTIGRHMEIGIEVNKTITEYSS